MDSVIHNTSGTSRNMISQSTKQSSSYNKGEWLCNLMGEVLNKIYKYINIFLIWKGKAQNLFMVQIKFHFKKTKTMYGKTKTFENCFKKIFCSHFDRLLNILQSCFLYPLKLYSFRPGFSAVKCIYGWKSLYTACVFCAANCPSCCVRSPFCVNLV